MKMMLFLVVVVVSLPVGNKLSGRWESISPISGNITGVVFKDDNTFEGYINQKPFVTGTYSLRDSIYEMKDNGCMDATGTYIIHFFSNDDSFRIKLVNDPCEPRGKGSDNRVFGRVKK